MSVKQIIVLRRDLNMRKGKMAAQAAHASMKVFLDAAEPRNCTHPLSIPLWPAANDWLAGSFTKIVVGCDSEAEFHAIHERALAAGIKCAAIQDSGRTEFNGVPTWTALALGPDQCHRLDEITGDLKLL